MQAEKSTAQPLLAAAGIRKRYGKLTVLSDVSLKALPGQIVTLIGPNGSGKTTLLRILLGLELPDNGTVHRRAGLRIGYMPQRIQMDRVMPVTVRWFLSLYSSGGEAPGRVAEEVEAGHLLDASLHTLSGGELQRVMLARALLCRPELLVLDEPVQGVDISGQAALYALISRIRNRYGCAVLMVSHDLHLVMASTDEVICLNHHVCCAGHPQQVKADPAFAQLFGPLVAESLALYVHRHDHTHDLGGDVHGDGEHAC